MEHSGVDSWMEDIGGARPHLQLMHAPHIVPAPVHTVQRSMDAAEPTESHDAPTEAPGGPQGAEYYVSYG